MNKPYILIDGKKIVLEYIVCYHKNEISLSNLRFGEKMHMFGKLVKWNNCWVLNDEIGKRVLFICEKKSSTTVNLLKHGYYVLMIKGDIIEKTLLTAKVYFYADLSTHVLIRSPEINLICPLERDVSGILLHRLSIISRGIVDLWGDIISPIPQPCLCISNQIEDMEMFAGYRCEGKSYKDSYAFIFFDEMSALPEIHEMTHLYLYRLGRPPFLFLEGMPTLMEQLLPKCAPNVTVLRSVAHNAFILNRNLRISDMLSSEYIHTALARNSGSYFFAASFLNWCREIYGWEKLKRCYVEYSHNKDEALKKDIFFTIFGISIIDAEKQWLRTLEK